MLRCTLRTFEQLSPGEYSDPVVVPSPTGEEACGAWRATASFRKLDGKEVQWKLHAWGDTEDAALQAAISAIDDERGMQVQTMGFDLPPVRTYIAAASHMHDLRQALLVIETSTLTDDVDIQRHLRAHAVNVYGRTWHSKVRKDLTDYVEFSKGDAELTESIKILRNRFAGHSENR